MREVQDQLRQFSRAMVDTLPELDPASVLEPVVRDDHRPAGRSWRVLAAAAGLVAVVAIPAIVFRGEPPVDTVPSTTPDQLQPVEASVVMHPFVDGAPWAQVAYIPYGDTPETLGAGEAWGPELPVSRDTAGNWWVSDVYKRRIAVFGPDLSLRQAAPVDLPHSVLGIWVHDDNTAVGLTPRDEVAVISGGSVAVHDVLEIGDGTVRLLSSDGRRVFGEIYHENSVRRFAIDLVEGSPIVSPVDYFTTPLGNRFLLDSRAEVALPDAQTPVEVRFEVSAADGESVMFSADAIGGSDGSIHLLFLGSSSGDETLGLGVYVQVGSDGSIIRTETIPNPYGARDGGGPRLSLDPVTGRPFITVVEGLGIRIWRLDDVPPPDPSTSTTLPEEVGPPSQSEADALRDGVLPALAAIRFDLRVEVLSQLEADEGVWVLSKPTQELIEMTSADGCVLGDPRGLEPDAFICTSEYGEILLLDPSGNIVRAFPMPNTPPSWIEVTDDYVYVGKIGDGALTHSALVRIDRETLEAVYVVIGVDGDRIPSWMWGSNWLVADETYPDRLAAVVGFGPEAPGRPVTSWVGDVRVDIEGVDRIIRELIDSGGVVAG